MIGELEPEASPTHRQITEHFAGEASQLGTMVSAYGRSPSTLRLFGTGVSGPGSDSEPRPAAAAARRDRR